MRIVLASHNAHKIKELQSMLRTDFPDVEILSPADVGIDGDIEENGTTFAENARIKATAVASSGFIGIGDDSGLCVDLLDGEPGVYSARFAEMAGKSDVRSDDANNRYLCERLAPYAEKDCTAAFVCNLYCALPNGRFFTVEGKVEGIILKEGRGEDGFGYDPFFYYPPMNKTFAEMTAEEKNAVSHRAAAMRALKEKLKEYL